VTLNKRVVPGLVFALVFAGLALAPSGAQEGKKEPKTPPWEKAKEKFEAARKAYSALYLEYKAGKATIEQCSQWSQRLMNAQREAKNTRANNLEALEQHLGCLQELEKAAQERADKNRGQISDVYVAEYHRIEAESALAKAKSTR